MPSEPQPKRNVYVGGLEEQVNEEILHAAFVPFGDIVEVSRGGLPSGNSCRYRLYLITIAFQFGI